MIDQQTEQVMRHNDMRILQHVLIQHRWILNMPSLYRMDNFDWRHLEDLVEPIEDSQGSLLNLEAHYKAKPAFYAPYVAYALEAQLATAARIEWYGSNEHVLRRLILAVPRTKEDQKALLAYAQGGEHPLFGTLEQEEKAALDQVELLKNDVVKRWTEQVVRSTRNETNSREEDAYGI